jgi:hypothetical protein
VPASYLQPVGSHPLPQGSQLWPCTLYLPLQTLLWHSTDRLYVFPCCRLPKTITLNPQTPTLTERCSCHQWCSSPDGQWASHGQRQ